MRARLLPSPPSGRVTGGGPKIGGRAKHPSERRQILAEVTSVSNRQKKEQNMLRWAAIFFVIAIIAALFGFTGIAGARFLFFLFVAIFVVLFLLGVFAGKKML